MPEGTARVLGVSAWVRWSEEAFAEHAVEQIRRAAECGGEVIFQAAGTRIDGDAVVGFPQPGIGAAEGGGRGAGEGEALAGDEAAAGFGRGVCCEVFE